MTVYLVNPSDLSFGIGVITPRWLFVIAGATPPEHGDPVIVDEAIELAKKFGSENSGRFVNGLLDGILQSEAITVDDPVAP